MRSTSEWSGRAVFVRTRMVWSTAARRRRGPVPTPGWTGWVWFQRSCRPTTGRRRQTPSTGGHRSGSIPVRVARERPCRRHFDGPHRTAIAASTATSSLTLQRDGPSANYSASKDTSVLSPAVLINRRVRGRELGLPGRRRNCPLTASGRSRWPTSVRTGLPAQLSEYPAGITSRRP